MRLGNFAVEIPQGKELDSGYVAMKHNTQYTIRLSNFGDVRCDVEVEIDGKEIGGWRLRKNKSGVIERPVHDTGCFTFYKVGTDEAKKAELVHSDKLGLITVLFMPEKKMDKDKKFMTLQMNRLCIGGGTGLSGKSDQKFRSVPRLENYDEEGFMRINLRLICDTENDEPRPLTAASTPVPPPLPGKVIL